MKEDQMKLLSRTSSMSSAPIVATVVIGVVMMAVSPLPAFAADFKEQQALVDKAKMTVDAFAADSALGPATREMAHEAKGLFIIPQFLRGAFVFGGARGSGVFLARDKKQAKGPTQLFIPSDQPASACKSEATSRSSYLS
jgi:hypothetical protein